MDTQPNKIENTKWTAATATNVPRRPPQPPPLCRERFIHLQFCLDYNLDFSSRDAQIRSSRILNLIFCPTNIMETTNLKAVALKELWRGLKPLEFGIFSMAFKMATSEIQGLSSFDKAILSFNLPQRTWKPFELKKVLLNTFSLIFNKGRSKN